jgi:uncharacterized protein (DUF1684 family)
VLRREGLWAGRDVDPDAPACRAFKGIEVMPYDPRWVLAGRFFRERRRELPLPFPAAQGTAPAADGAVSVDLNGARLPPCAFAGPFLCPFPPPGNTLPFPVPAGERNLLTA